MWGDMGRHGERVRLADCAAAGRADEPEHGAPEHLELHDGRQVVEAGQHLPAHTAAATIPNRGTTQRHHTVAHGSGWRHACRGAGGRRDLLKQPVRGRAAAHAPSQLQVARGITARARPPHRAGRGGALCEACGGASHLGPMRSMSAAVAAACGPASAVRGAPAPCVGEAPGASTPKKRQPAVIRAAAASPSTSATRSRAAPLHSSTRSGWRCGGVARSTSASASVGAVTRIGVPGGDRHPGARPLGTAASFPAPERSSKDPMRPVAP